MHRTDKLVVGALGLTAGITGVLSYAGLQKFATDSGQSLPGVWPFALDVPAAALSFAVWRAHSQGRSAIGGRVAIGALVFLSAALQVSTADIETTKAPDWAVYVGHALPACVFAVLWETLLWLRRTPTVNAVDTANTAADLRVDDDNRHVVYDAANPPAPVPARTEPVTVAARTPVPVQASPVVVAAPVVATHPPLRPGREGSPPISTPRKRKGKAASGGTAAAVATVRAMLDEGLDITSVTLAERMGQDKRSGYRHLQKPEVQAVLNEGISETDPDTAADRLNALDSGVTLARTAAERGAERADPPLSSTDSPVSTPVSVVSDASAGRVPVGAG